MKRYDLVYSPHFCNPGVGKEDNGKYVLHEDFLKLQKAYEELVSCSGVECPTVNDILSRE